MIMSDFKSKLPDFKELTSMGSKLFKGIKSSIDEIINDYKQKRTEEEAPKRAHEAAEPVKKASPQASKKPVTQTEASQPVDPVTPDGTNDTMNNGSNEVK